jgi:penicillin-binding protein activator
MTATRIAALVTVMTCVAGCTTYDTARVKNSGGRNSQYVDPGTSGPIKGVGVESQDIVNMTDRMMRDMMTNVTLAGQKVAPRIIIDTKFFHNESASRINLNMITDRLRIGLNRASKGRMVFIARHHADMVEHERDLKRNGVVGDGATGRAVRPAGGDYRLGGRIADLNAIDPQTGLKSRYHQVSFEMVNLETGVIIWSGQFDFKKVAQDDVIYR